MDGFLTEREMQEMQSAGFDLQKFYIDFYISKQFIIVETTRKLTNEEVEEMIKDGDGDLVEKARVLVNEETFYVKVGEKLKLSTDSHAYVTLSTANLMEYLAEFFMCDYKIYCEIDDVCGCQMFKKIEYIENNKTKFFELEEANIYFESLLCSFIVYLLTTKKYLLKF